MRTSRLRRLRYTASLLALGLICCTASGGSSKKSRVRGQLIWTKERQTLQPCEGAEIYWVRVLVANPHFLFSKRVDELLRADPGAPLIADLEGTPSGPPSQGPRYRVDKTFAVSQIHSVELGSCPK